MSSARPPAGISDDRTASLQSRIAGLRQQRVSGCHFREWRPGIFYCLFAFVAVALAVFLTDGYRHLSLVVAAVCLFVTLCCLPSPLNRLRYWYLIRRPNRRLQRQIDWLQTKIDRCK